MLHQSPKLIETADTRALVRAKELRTEAERALRKAQALAAGGFARNLQRVPLAQAGGLTAAVVSMWRPRSSSASARTT